MLTWHMWEWFALLFVILACLPGFFRYLLWHCANDEFAAQVIYMENLAIALTLPFIILLLIYTMLPPHQYFEFQIPIPQPII